MGCHRPCQERMPAQEVRECRRTTVLARALTIQILIKMLCLRKLLSLRRCELKSTLILVAIALSLSDAAIAQTACAQGVAAGSAQCGPSSLVNPNETATQDQNKQPLPSVKWADSWGAIAGDGVATFGVATDFPSKRKAKKAAIEDCKERGGGRCRLDRAFANQCAAIIAGETMSATANAQTKRDAVALGMQICEQEGGTNCHTYWSGCSHAWRVW